MLIPRRQWQKSVVSAKAFDSWIVREFKVAWRKESPRPTFGFEHASHSRNHNCCACDVWRLRPKDASEPMQVIVTLPWTRNPSETPSPHFCVCHILQSSDYLEIARPGNSFFASRRLLAPISERLESVRSLGGRGRRCEQSLLGTLPAPTLSPSVVLQSSAYTQGSNRATGKRCQIPRQPLRQSRAAALSLCCLVKLPLERCVHSTIRSVVVNPWVLLSAHAKHQSAQSL